MKGVILAGGKGTRLLPATKITNKHLIPIGSIPMIEFPLRVLKQFGIKDILLVSGGEHIGDFAEYLEDGSDFGVSLTYRIQKEAGGIAHALLQAEGFLQSQRSIVILGDNIFAVTAFEKIPAVSAPDRAMIVLKDVGDPERFGVVRFDLQGRIAEVIEKPVHPPSHSVVTGLYFFPADVFDVIRGLRPSPRGELEITDVNNFYIQNRRMDHIFFNGFWSDAGTPDSLLRVYKEVLGLGK